MLNSRNMDSSQLLVQSDEPPLLLGNRFCCLLENQAYVDVILICDTHILQVHSAVLAAFSPYFERELRNHSIIVLQGMNYSVLKSLIEFMYCGRTSVTEETLSSLLDAARFLEVKGLCSINKFPVCTPNVETPLPTTFSHGRGGRGRRRGQGRPPFKTSSKLGSQTESAQILLSLSGTHTPQLYSPNEDSNVMQNLSESKMSSNITFAPRRRGRKRGALNSALRDMLRREADAQMAIMKSLVVEDKNSEMKQVLDDEEETLPSLTNGVVTQAETEPEAVVLYEVIGNTKMAKLVFPANQVSMLKSINEELTKLKKELADITNNQLYTGDTAESNIKVAELKLEIKKTKSILSEIVGHTKDTLKI